MKSKLKDELYIVSTATEVQRQEMMIIMKHVNLTVQGDRAVRCETHQRKAAASQSRSIQEPMQMSSRSKQMAWPSGENNDNL